MLVVGELVLLAMLGQTSVANYYRMCLVWILADTINPRRTLLHRSYSKTRLPQYDGTTQKASLINSR